MLPIFSKAQNKNAITTGLIKGKVKDSVYKFMLTSATIAVYNDADSSLLQYTLPNNFGEFTVNLLPVNILLRLVITHVGYKSLAKKFTLTTDKNELDLGFLYLYQGARDSGGNILEEVVVKSIPPMRMNGDTLEFNADAFKMDPNATAEDLMRRLPGIVIWGDGDITFNGKKITTLLVNGKPFMGTNDMTVATQNLPKDALNKVQIYEQRDEKNPLDSTMFANLKLKEDKSTGYFGKASAGNGLSAPSVSKEKRYAVDGMLSGFNKKLQIAIVGGANNVNKMAQNVDALIKNSSYKGEGNNLEYQSDFNTLGINKPIMGGVRLQYDFIPDVQYNKSSRLYTDYFINHNNTDIINTNLEKNFITADTILSAISNGTSFNQSTGQRASARYERNADRDTFSISVSGTANESENSSQSQSSQEKTGVGVINNNNAVNESYNNAKNVQAGFSFTKGRVFDGYSKLRRIPSEFTFSYSLNTGENKGHSKSQTAYEFTNQPQSNSSVSRLYDKRNSGNTGHRFAVSYPRLKELIFNKKNFGGIDIELSANYKLSNNYSNDLVRDFDTTTNNYIVNAGLTCDRTETIRDFTPGLRLSKNFFKGLTNRYNKYVRINFNASQQYYSYGNSSTQADQNLSYSYQKFIPDASVEYYNHQYGEYEVRYSLNYSSNMEYPSIWQIAPLVDVADPLYLPKGNPNLKPQYRQNVDFKYKFTTRTPKNPWDIDAGVSIGKVTDNIVDSTLYDDKGGRTVYMININGNKYLNSNISIKKILEVNKNNTFEIGIRYNYNLLNDPRYIDNSLNTSITKNQGGSFNINYRHKDIVNVKLEQSLNYYNAEQRGFNNNSFKSNYRYTRAMATLQLPKNLTWSSNITYNSSLTGNSDAVNFTIWNASLTYRFFKNNNGEVKFSALDLLRQNKGITNTVNGNVQNFGYTNVLQQYFMLTLSYYPRKFGK